MKNKTIIIFDGHGLTNREKTILKYTHHFLCDEGKTVSSDEFNHFIKQLVRDKGLTDLSNLPNNFEAQLEHFLFELTLEQKLSSATCNLRKAVNLDPSSKFKLKEISKIISDSEINYNFKIQFTDFHPETKCQLVYVRIENKGSVKLSILEKLIFPMFIDSTNPILESCGMPMLETTEESEAVGLWGACREIFEEKSE
jgi:hypothetical protein